MELPSIEFPTRSLDPLFEPEFKLLFELGVSLEAYYAYQYSLYDKHDMAHQEFDHWQVTELLTYKANGESDDLVATLTNGKEKIRLFLFRQTEQFPTRATGQGVIIRLRSSVDSDDDQRPQKFTLRVIDRVRTLAGTSTAYTMNQRPLAEHIMFPEGHRISLLKLVLLASTVKEYSKTRHFKQSNFYGLSYVIVEALKTRYPEHRLLPIQRKYRRDPSLTVLSANKLPRHLNMNELLAKADRLWDEYIERRISTIPEISVLKRSGSVQRRNYL